MIVLIRELFYNLDKYKKSDYSLIKSYGIVKQVVKSWCVFLLDEEVKK